MNDPNTAIDQPQNLNNRPVRVPQTEADHARLEARQVKMAERLSRNLGWVRAGGTRQTATPSPVGVFKRKAGVIADERTGVPFRGQPEKITS